jgi:hypothetical protein
MTRQTTPAISDAGERSHPTQSRKHGEGGRWAAVEKTKLLTSIHDSSRISTVGLSLVLLILLVPLTAWRLLGGRSSAAVRAGRFRSSTAGIETAWRFGSCVFGGKQGDTVWRRLMGLEDREMSWDGMGKGAD